MTQERSFNDVILKLLTFWKDKGCLVWQPYNVQVGAGTMNPATVLRVLAPEPWNVVYVEPSIRPDDGRFGDNPNRLQMHHQLQVILQPDPGNPQEIYLESLEAIGIDRKEHDIRFVEDNWESPALGAWGLGWEVWLDGQEITQFTYFQQAGSFDLDPVAVEITYGLDRIIATLQGVDSVWEIDFGAGLSYDQLLLQSEIEHCQYYFNVADVDALRQTYEIYEREASRCLEAGLVAPAHDYNLKCSHLFNIMDTRGAIGVTERAQYFRRMRNMARAISQEYIAQREALGFPLNENPRWQAPALETAGPLAITADTPQTFLLEIGSEELPATDVPRSISQLRRLVPDLLDELRIPYEQIDVYGTPRRLVVIGRQVAPRQRDLETEVKGPPAERAYNAEGIPTRAAEGFARGKGVDVADLRIVSEGDKKYVAATIFEAGRPTQEVLAAALPDLVAGIKFPKSMRWNDSNVAYSRPLRWLVALFGPDQIPFVYAGLASGRTSRGLRPDRSPAITINSAEEYEKQMSAHGIVIDPARREEIITAVSRQLATEQEGGIPEDPGLLEEVTNLIERPTPFLGTFEEKFLALPDEVLVAVMRKHQRYFPVYGKDGRLLPYFIGVRNGDSEHLDQVIHGNEQVIRARFADAAFFYGNDRKRDLVDFLPDLDKLTFQADLGSMLDKTHRLERLVPAVADLLGLSTGEKEDAQRAAALSKADLASSMVVEMTSLQGIMGGIFARESGENEAVAAAIAEQYEAISRTRPGLALALADRLDSLAGLFAAGLAPKGSNDPFALRRAAIHLLENLIANRQSFDLQTALRTAAGLLPASVEATARRRQEALAFITDRLSVMLQEEGYRPTLVRAVLNEQAHDPYGARLTVTALEELTRQADWPLLLDAYARCVRITRGEEDIFPLRPEAFLLEAEQDLLAAYQQAAAASNGSLATFAAQLRQLEPVISRFFDDVLVMDDDLGVRHNRLALLQRVAALAAGIVDLSEVEGF